MLQSTHESVSMPAHWGSAGFFILTYLNRSVFGWAYSPRGEQLGCPTQTLVVGRKAWSFSIPELTIASKDKRVGTAIHTGQRKRLEPGSAGSQMTNNKIKSSLLRRSCPADSGKTWEACSSLGLLSWPTWWCGLWNCFCYSHRNLFHGLTGTCLVRANKLKPMASYTSDSSHRAFMCSSESL